MADRHFLENNLYQGEVTAQNVYIDREGVPALVLDIKLLGMLADPRRPPEDPSQLLECPKIDVEVRMAFPPDDPERMGYAQNDLERLGFEGDDLELLSPASKGKKGHFDLTGRTVFVTPKYKVYNDKESVFWNLRHPRQRAERKAEKGELAKSRAAEAYKALLKQRKEDAQRAAAGSPAPF